MTDTVEVLMIFNDPNELAERYTTVWMEPDGDRRRKAIADLWSEDAIHILQPTQEVYEAAAERAVNPTWQVRGHDELEARVTSAYEDFVATGQMSFRARDGAKRLGDVVTWRWEGVSPDGRRRPDRDRLPVRRVSVSVELRRGVPTPQRRGRMNVAFGFARGSRSAS
jgi:hypothetical protein